MVAIVEFLLVLHRKPVDFLSHCPLLRLAELLDRIAAIPLASPPIALHEKLTEIQVPS